MALSFLCLNDLFARFGAFRHPYVAADDGTFGQGDASEDCRVTIDDDVVLEYRVARDALDGISVVVEGEALCAECDALVELHVVADDARCSDDDACAVVDGEVVPYLGSGMDVDARLAVRHFGDDAGNEGHAQQQQLVGDAVAGEGLDDWIAADDFAV